MKTFLLGLILATALLFGAVWQWGDKLGIPLNQIILDLHRARIESMSAARRANDEIIRTMETKAEAEDATAAAVQITKELEEQRLELEKAAAKARIEANRLRNTTPAPTTPAPGSTSAGIPNSERGTILPEGDKVTLLASENQNPKLQKVADRGEGRILRVKKGEWFFYTQNSNHQTVLVTTGDLPEVRLDPGDSVEGIKDYFAKLLHGAKVVKEIEITPQDLAKFRPMGYLKVKGKQIPIFGIPYNHQQGERM